MNDPMLTGNAEEQEAYQGTVMEKVMAAIEEDRANRRKETPTRQSPAVLLGGTGSALGGAVTEVL